MPDITSSDYHDYVIKDGRFIGEFEQMYRNVDDPWHCVAEAHAFKNDLLIGAVTHLRAGVRRALDVGCGLGALTARLRTAAPEAEWHACDLSPTAVAKAAAATPGVRFFQHDVRESRFAFQRESLDLITMAEVMWYVLPQLERVLREFHRLLAPGGHLVTLQYFPKPEDQAYGKEFVSAPADLLRLLREAGFELAHDVYFGEPRYAVLAVARKPQA
jgi:SAM-dependent methyltransferase